MNIFPAIDLIDGKAVRLVRGDYSQMTVYHNQPLTVAQNFAKNGAKYLHVVDLEGARDGSTPNIETVKSLIDESGLFVEIGGGIRSMETVDKYISAGVYRVILGTAAVTDPDFLKAALEKYGEKIAVGADIKDGFVAIKGWLEKSEIACDDFFADMQKLGVRTIICTDISKDGAMKGTNRALYRALSERFSIDIVASGGVSAMDDVRALRQMELYGAIIGKAYYTGAIALGEAIEVAK